MGCCGWRASDRRATAAPSWSAGGAETVARQRGMAEQALMAATGGKPLCRVGEGPDHHVEHVKHAEGCVAAIAEVQPRLRSTGEGPAAAGRVIREGWRAGEDAVRGRGGVWLV